MENEFDFFNTLSGSDFDKTKLGNYGTFNYVPPPLNINYVPPPLNILPIDTTQPFLKGIKTIDQPYQSNNGGSGSGGGGFSLPIDYDNLIIPSSESEQKNNMFTNAIDKFKSFTDNNKALSGIMKLGSIIKDPAMALFTSAMGMLPKEDPRATAARNFYGENFGLKSDNRIASGIMENYNPVSGGFLNMITGGRMGEETQYGLERAVEKRMDNIINMISNKYNYSYTNDKKLYEDMLDGKVGGYGIKGHTSAVQNYFKLKSIKQAQAQAMSATNAAAAEKQRQEFLKSDTRNDPVTGTVALQQKIGSSAGNERYTGGGGYDSTSSKPDRPTSSVTKTSAAKSKGVGGGGYTKSDTTRESYRGRYGTGGIVSL